MNHLLEVCVDSLASARAAVAGGADVWNCAVPWPWAG